MRKRAYRSVSVKNVNAGEVLLELAEGSVWVGVDVAKGEVLVSLRDNAGNFQRPWKAKQPSEIGILVSHLSLLAKERPLIVAMESTGTYGDALRQSLTDAGLKVHRVSSKGVKDYAEVFDGVPSNHDGKDAAIIAELASLGKTRAWPSVAPSEWEAKVDRQVHWLDTQQEILQLWLGRLEAFLARHWPEIQKLLKLNSVTLLRTLAKYGGPAALAASTDGALQLRKWGKNGLSPEKLQAVLDSARTTVGVRMVEETMHVMRDYAREALKARKEIQQAKRTLKGLAAKNKQILRMAQVVGPITGCVLWASVGDPHEYHCGDAYRKAMGLNLKERSSGKYQGKLKITKRGPSIARRWLYFAALRRVQQMPVKTWFEKKKAKDKDRGLGGIVAVMRKLALAIHAVTTRDEPFVLERLLPGRPYPRGNSPALSGGLPPDPRDLSPAAKTKGKGRPRIDPDRPFVSAPGTALGSVPTVALSSAQAKQQIAH